MKRFHQPVSPIRCQANLSKKKSSFVVVEVFFFSGSVERGRCVGWAGVVLDVLLVQSRASRFPFCMARM